MDGVALVRTSNRTLGERVHDALVKAAEAKSEADRAEKLAKRIFSQLVIDLPGSSVASKEHAARTHPTYVKYEDEAIQRATAANIAKAEADGLDIRFKEWQSKHATERAEMNLR
jgi:trehalose-6-phosphatase